MKSKTSRKICVKTKYEIFRQWNTKSFFRMFYIYIYMYTLCLLGRNECQEDALIQHNCAIWTVILFWQMAFFEVASNCVTVLSLFYLFYLFYLYLTLFLKLLCPSLQTNNYQLTPGQLDNIVWCPQIDLM